MTSESTVVAALMIAANKNLTPADVRGYLKSTGTCPNGLAADSDGTGTCVGKGQWGNDPDGIAEPLVASGDLLPILERYWARVPIHAVHAGPNPPSPNLLALRYSLFDHLVGGGEPGGNGEAERLSGL